MRSRPTLPLRGMIRNHVFEWSLFGDIAKDRGIDLAIQEHLL